MGVKTDKQEYFNKLKGLLEDYKSIFIVSVDNVCSASNLRKPAKSMC
jgi:large subunit ribosomal protein LP0